MIANCVHSNRFSAISLRVRGGPLRERGATHLATFANRNLSWGVFASVWSWTHSLSSNRLAT